MVFQPFDDCSSLYDALVCALDDERLTELSVVVAWAKESGLQHIRPNLQAFRARGGKARILLGIDADGATFEGLYAAIDDFDEARVLFNASSRTFHPKLYMITGETASAVIIGSANLTKGGLVSNYEAGIYLELDLGDDSDAQKHKALTDYIKRLHDDGTTRLLDKDLIQQLPDYFHIGSEAHPKTNKAVGDSSGISEKRKDAAKLFGASHHKMKPNPLKHPATKSAKTPGSDISTGPEGSLGDVQPTMSDTSAREAIRLLGERKRGRSFPLPLPGGGVGQVPCEAVPKLIFWCWDTAVGPRSHASFKVEARKQGVLAAAEWSAGYQYIGLNPENRLGKYSPHKPEIADHLLDKLSQA
jgi:HKD family nuclease